MYEPTPADAKAVGNAQLVIVNGLAKADPAHATAYQQRGEAYLAQLKVTDQWVREQLAAVSPAKRRVTTSHDAFGYFGIAYGVEFLAPVGWNTENEPSAKQIATLIRQIKNRTFA